jgi:hypothetical protein
MFLPRNVRARVPARASRFKQAKRATPSYSTEGASPFNSKASPPIYNPCQPVCLFTRRERERASVFIDNCRRRTCKASRWPWFDEPCLQRVGLSRSTQTISIRNLDHLGNDFVPLSSHPSQTSLLARLDLLVEPLGGFGERRDAMIFALPDAYHGDDEEGDGCQREGQ